MVATVQRETGRFVPVYREARRIINGTDKARELAVCASWIEGLLWLATKACFGSSIYRGGAPR